MNKTIILLILIIIILFSILFFFQKKTKKQFLNLNSDALNYCVDKNSVLGIRMNNGNCISLKSTDVNTSNELGISNLSIGNNNRESNIQFIDSIVEEEEEEDISFSDINNISSSSDLDSMCFPKNSNFGSICNKYQGDQYGVSEIAPCNNNSGKKVTCKLMTFNGINYKDNNTFSTNCIDKSLDFDTMCNNYIPESIQSNIVSNGYTQSSSGLKTKLIGKDGDCYNPNGNPDNSRARGICNVNFNNEIPKVDPFIYNQDSNVFTSCLKMNPSNFINKCSSLLNIEKNNVYADIEGHDCFPGYGRAKCVDKKKNIHVSPSIKKFKKDSDSNIYHFPNMSI